MSGPADPTRALKARLSAMPGRLNRELGSAFEDVGAALAAEARRRLTATASRSATAAPRETRQLLVDTLSVRPHESDPGVTVAVSSPVARFLEYGTSRMAARPFLRPAAEAVRTAAAARCRAALARAAQNPKAFP